MENTKKALLIIIITMILGCKEEVLKYPRYSLETVEYVPDSLKVKHRQWITETVRAASQQMTGGDYEDVDQTIIQAKRTADELFCIHEIGLRKKIDNSFFGDVILNKHQMTATERTILKQLSVTR